MAHLIAVDAIDFAAYERSTETAHKVRKASDFAEDLERAFVPPHQRKRSPSMQSTKARSVIEFRPGEVTAWAGFNGHRKSMLVGQVMLDLIAQGQRVLCASLEMQPGQTLARMCRQACAAAVPPRAMRDEFVRWTDSRLWIFDHMGRVSPEMAVGLVRYFATELEGHHVVLDSMMMIVGSEEHMDEQKQLVTDLVRVAQECSVHVHLVCHCRKPASGDEAKPPTKYEIRGASAISDQAANVITVWANKAKAAKVAEGHADDIELDKPDALVSIEKQRNGSFEGRLMLWFDDRSFRFCDDRTSAVEPFAMTGARAFSAEERAA